jgi:hypothetical protein
MNLRRMLEQAEECGYQDVVSWLPEGKSFKIHDPEGMISVLCMYFKQTRYKSFLRQIQNYGFHRVTRGPRKGVCTHELFIRDEPPLSLQMNRAQSAGMDLQSMSLTPPPPQKGQCGGGHKANTTTRTIVPSTSFATGKTEERRLALRLFHSMDMKEKPLWRVQQEHKSKSRMNKYKKEVLITLKQAQQEQATHEDDSSWLTKLLENQECWMTATNMNNHDNNVSLGNIFEPNHIVFPTSSSSLEARQRTSRDERGHCGSTNIIW